MLTEEADHLGRRPGWSPTRVGLPDPAQAERKSCRGDLLGAPTGDGRGYSNAQEDKLMTVATPNTAAAVSTTTGITVQRSLTTSMWVLN